LSLGVIFFVIAIIGFIFEIAFIYSKYNEVNKSLDEQCKNLTDTKAIKEFKRNHWLKGTKLTFRVFLYCLLPFSLVAIYIWFLVS